MGGHVLTLNAGSSSVKFALFANEAGWPRRIASGKAEGLGAAPKFTVRAPGREPVEHPFPDGATQETAILAVLQWIADLRPAARIGAIGHRIVHGGLRYAAPIVLDERIIAQLRTLVPLAPLHQPHNLAGVDAARAAFPNVPQIACFDTAFHRGHAFVHDAYALPRDYYQRGLRRFGFHGLSYEYIARRLRETNPAIAEGRVIVAHLGNGASLCALRDGRSVACTLGFSPLDGLPMGTRCGQIDPGLILHLIEHQGLSAADVTHLLYERSGLLGLSGVSGDMRVLEASSDPNAREAIDFFANRICMEVGALAAALSGLDALVFTAGIGENSAHLRARVGAGLEWLGASLDRAANERHAPSISTSVSRIELLVTPTDEEAMIALHTIETAGLACAKAIST